MAEVPGYKRPQWTLEQLARWTPEELEKGARFMNRLLQARDVGIGEETEVLITGDKRSIRAPNSLGGLTPVAGTSHQNPEALLNPGRQTRRRSPLQQF